VAHHAQIVRHEQIGQAELILQIRQQVDDLRLYRDIKCRDRFVGDDQFGSQRQRARDADPLSLPAGELVRVSVVVLGL
jgi:hypothetical protein